MNEQATTILGISPGTYTLGIAVLHNNRLIDRRMKNFKGDWSDSKLIKMVRSVEEMIDKHSVTVIAIKKHPETKTSANITLLIDNLKELSKKRKIKIHWYVIEELERFYTRERRVNKSTLMDAILEEFPELTFIHSLEKKSKVEYYVKVFEAIAAAQICAHEMS